MSRTKIIFFSIPIWTFGPPPLKMERQTGYYLAMFLKFSWSMPFFPAGHFVFRGLLKGFWSFTKTRDMIQIYGWRRRRRRHQEKEVDALSSPDVKELKKRIRIDNNLFFFFCFQIGIPNEIFLFRSVNVRMQLSYHMEYIYRYKCIIKTARVCVGCVHVAKRLPLGHHSIIYPVIKRNSSAVNVMEWK